MNLKGTRFENSRLGMEIFVYDVNGEEMFIGKDIAEMLGYADTSATVSKRVNEAYKNKVYVKTIENIGNCQNGNPEKIRYMNNITLISEFGLYQLVTGSKMPKAIDFQKWIYEEVLPSLRKHGAYVDEKFEDKKLQEKYLKIVNLTMSLCRSREHALSSISKEIFNGNRAALKRKLVEDGYISEDMTTILKGHFKDHSGVIRPILLQKNTQIMVDGEIKTRHNITATGYGFAHFMYKYNNIAIDK